MKKVLVALAMILGVGSSAAFAQEVKTEVVTEAQASQDEFVKMDPAQLPQEVLQALSTEHEGSSVKEAYVKEKDGAKIYKVIITGKDGMDTEVILNEKGEAVKV